MKTKSGSKLCPNCKKGKLEKIMDEWVCNECEYHSKALKKKAGGSFR